MLELVDSAALRAVVRKDVRVRVSPWALVGSTPEGSKVPSE